MYQPTSRVLTVLELLQSHPRMSGPEIAARLEVDVRTVRRYVTTLQDLGIPIEAETGRHGGYTLRPGFKLPPLMFTDDEAMALVLGLLVARRLGLTAAAPPVEGALAKIERVLPDAVRERVQAVYAALAIGIEAPETQIAHVLLGLLSLAVRQCRQVDLRYDSGRGATERAFDPYGVAAYAGRWYTVGFCHLRNEVRVFRLDRVQHVALGDELFVPPKAFNTLDYIIASFAAIPDVWDVEVIVDGDLETIRRRLPASLVQLEAHSDGVFLRASIDDLDMLARELARLGCPLTIITPPELRSAFRRLASFLNTL